MPGQHVKPTIALAALVALTACTGPGGDALFSREAGAVIDDGSFGAATATNTNVMANPEQYRIDLAKRFAAEVTSMVTFAFDSATLDAPAMAALDQQANWIRQFPEVRFRVYGHTDAVGPQAYNKALGLRRANAVVAYLANRGISRTRLEALVSFGETQPLIITQGRERRNRRTVTEVSGFVARHPQVLDGKYAEIVYREYVESATARTGLSGISGAEFQTGN